MRRAIRRKGGWSLLLNQGHTYIGRPNDNIVLLLQLFTLQIIHFEFWYCSGAAVVFIFWLLQFTTWEYKIPFFSLLSHNHKLTSTELASFSKTDMALFWFDATMKGINVWKIDNTIRGSKIPDKMQKTRLNGITFPVTQLVTNWPWRNFHHPVHQCLFNHIIKIDFQFGQHDNKKLFFKSRIKDHTFA